MQNEVGQLYDQTMGFYELLWHGSTGGIHYGIWDDSTRTLKDSLLNTNEVLAGVASIQPGEKVLDAGCGVGGSALWLARHRGANVTGITISKRQCARARDLALQQGLERSVAFHLRDFTETGFPDGSFDVVWAIESACYAPDKADFLRECCRVLRPGGRLAVADFFLEREPCGDLEVSIAQNVSKGFAVADPVPVGAFEAMARSLGFGNVRVWDRTDAIVPTARMMARRSRWLWPAAVLAARLRLAPSIVEANCRAAIDQHYLVAERIITYRIVLAEKARGAI